MMKVIVTGATGFIGEGVVRALRREGDEVIEAGRGAAALPIDLGEPAPARWRELLRGADALINCAGVFGDGAGQRAETINHTGAAALFSACSEAGVRRVVQFSAIGAQEGRSAFARSKRAADEALMALDLDWVILRPAIVFGANAAGGAGLLRGLAGLPVQITDERAGDLQLVQLEDVARTACALVRTDAPARIVLDLVGPERLSFSETVQHIRAWLGWRRSGQVRLPSWLMTIGFACGDLAAWLGWRTSIRSDARTELARGATGDPSAWVAAAGVAPESLSEALQRRSATAQDRLHAACYFLQPLVIAVTALFFIGTGVISLWGGYDIGVALLEAGGMGPLSGPSVIAGGVADIVVGAAIAYRPTARLGLYAALSLGLIYFAVGTLLLPELWRDPIGPMLKIWPLLVLNLAALAMVRDR